MGTKNPRFERFFARDTRWRAEMNALREIALSCPLSEELKWRQPVYCWQGRNIATLAGLEDRCVLSFFKGVLLTDPKNILTPPGPNSRSARYAAFTSADEIKARAETLRAYITEAIENEKAGRNVDLPADDFDLPEELATALDADPALAEAWAVLTPGRRRGWVIRIGDAKQPATRARRVDKAVPDIMAGRGIRDR